MKLGCILMASGQSSRFNKNKLLSLFNGKLMIEYILSELPVSLFEKIVVVTAFPQIQDIATSYGIPSILNPYNHLGISHTIKLGLDFVDKVDGCMFCVCDQPLCSKDSFKKLFSQFLSHQNHIVALGHDGKRGNPVIFPNYLFTELYQLKGDTGGSYVINQHPDVLHIVDANFSFELLDIDSKEDLTHLNEFI